MLEQDEIPIALSPVNFFQYAFSCLKLEEGGSFPRIQPGNMERYRVPVLSHLSNEEPFARCAMGWNSEGIEIFVQVSCPFTASYFPDIQKGDAVEVFLDTRDNKSTGFLTRFCHHFYFLPAAVDGHQRGEMTRFRTDDRHELCDPRELQVRPTFHEASYSLSAWIPASCLTGYDPDQFDRLGFSYRIHRAEGGAQHFSVGSMEFALENQPALWGQVRLMK